MSSRQANERQRVARIPVLGLIGVVTTVIGVVRFWGGRKGKRPTGTQLRQMSDADFAAFIRDSGLKTVTTAGLAVDGYAD
jgi:hypothetical protein